MDRKVLSLLIVITIIGLMVIYQRTTGFGILYIVFLGLVILAGFLDRYYKEQKINKLHKTENLINGAEDEPRYVRQLTQEEELILQDKIKNAQFLHQSLWFIVVLCGILDAIMIWFIIEYKPFIEQAIQFVVPIFIGEAILFTKAARHENLYLDLRSPVFRIAGHVIKEQSKGKNRTRYYLDVRDIEFSDEEFPELAKIFDKIHNNDRMEIEYSPRTKYVWSWKKL